MGSPASAQCSARIPQRWNLRAVRDKEVRSFRDAAAAMQREHTSELSFQAVGERIDDASATRILEGRGELFGGGLGVGVSAQDVTKRQRAKGGSHKRFSRIVWENMTGCCVTYAKHSRRKVRLTVLNSWLPNQRVPDDGSYLVIKLKQYDKKVDLLGVGCAYMRRMSDMVVLFPPPLLPMMQENFLAGKEQLKCFRTGTPGREGYANETFSNRIVVSMLSIMPTMPAPCIFSPPPTGFR